MKGKTGRSAANMGVVVGILAISWAVSVPAAAKKACPATRSDAPLVQSPPANYPAFYQKYVNANGIAILGDADVCDRSLQLAYLIISHMLYKRGDIRETLVARGAHIAVYSEGNTLLSVPEFASLPAAKKDTCGVTGFVKNPTSAVCETNLIGINDPFHGRASELIHEFGHLIHNVGMDKTTHDAVTVAYMHARDQHLFTPNQGSPPSYAMSNEMEFFAMATMAWFSAANWNAPFNSVHEKDRTAQATHDPEIDAILKDIYPEGDWQYPKK